MIDVDREFRDGLAEAVRNKPALGSIDLNAVRNTAQQRVTARRRAVPRWAAVAAAAVIITGLGLWFGNGVLPGPHVTDAQPAAPPAAADELVGTAWTLTSADRFPPTFSAPRTPTLSFADNGEVSGDDGCNSWSGTYQLDVDRLALTVVGATEARCGRRDDPSAGQAPYYAALAAVTTIQREGSQLTLFDRSRTPVLIFAQTSVEVRLRNDSSVTLGSIDVDFGTGGTGEYHDLAPGASSSYQNVRRAYRYAGVRAVVNGEDEMLLATDFVGESPLTPGRYTYVINYEQGQLGLTLETG